MISMNFKVVILAFVLQSCAGQQPELDVDHNAPTTEQTDSGDDRGFDPCKLNSKLPVCQPSAE